MTTHISAKISKTFEDALFQIAALYVNSKKYGKIITIPEQKSNTFVENSKMFNSDPISHYYELSDNDISHTIIPFNKDIMLVGKFKTFKPYDDDTLEYMRYFIYHNEDYMYEAYHQYNEIKKKCNADDDTIASVYIEDEANLAYYKKALMLMKKKNIVVFTSKQLSNTAKDILNEYDAQIVWNTNQYILFILMSLFKHNICQFYDAFYSIWAAYISKYDDMKTVIVPYYLKNVINENINNMNIIYLD